MCMYVFLKDDPLSCLPFVNRVKLKGVQSQYESRLGKSGLQEATLREVRMENCQLQAGEREYAVKTDSWQPFWHVVFALD